jgi:hypothetical protein
MQQQTEVATQSLVGSRNCVRFDNDWSQSMCGCESELGRARPP